MNWSPAARAVGAVSRALSVRSVATVHEFGPEAGEAGRLSTHLLLFDALGCIHAALFLGDRVEDPCGSGGAGGDDPGDDKRATGRVEAHRLVVLSLMPEMALAPLVSVAEKTVSASGNDGQVAHELIAVTA